VPEFDGIEVCRTIKAIPKWQSTPIIIVTALTDKRDLSNCLTAGADDFISKPLNGLELRARVRSMLRIRQQYQELAHFNTLLEEKVQQRTAELHKMIFQDALTELPSRNFLLRSIEQILQSGEYSFALVYLDCDQFKLINGSFGYDIGDQLLIDIAERLKQHLSDGDLLARIGEDEFCFLLNKIDDFNAVEIFIHKLLASFNVPVSVSGHEIFMTASAGIAMGRSTYEHSLQPLQDADTAMYKAKRQGKGCYQVFDHEMYQLIKDRLALENDLQRALERREFINYYQPIVNLKTLQVTGLEALIRWQHPTRGMVAPDQFISCMEETGLIVAVGMMVLKQACEQLYQWQRAGWPDLTMSVNLSIRQFTAATLLADIDQILIETSIPPASLKLEITESVLMDNTQTALTLTQELKARGIELCVDDFGTGYSSLSYLNQFPIDCLKIDRYFIQNIGTQGHKTEIVQAIVRLGHTLGLTLVAEGIETQAQLNYLQSLECEYGQGYFFSKPLSSEKVPPLLMASARAGS
jgi:diguanylate cyclase (GGDEF)-like protein